MERRYRSLMTTGPTSVKRASARAGEAGTAVAAKRRGPSGDRDAQLWGAVALQQHLVRSVALQGGFAGIHAPPPPRRGQLTLAQKMGLVEAPPPPPTEQQWGLAVSEAARRKETHKPCCICHEPFMSTSRQQQAILDCGHVFHETCIKQFEGFLRRSNVAPSCPVCRKRGYHRQPHREGVAQVQEFAATRIQAAFRGLLGRRAHLKLRLQRDPQFKADFYYGKLQSMTDSYVAYTAAREKFVNDFLEQLDVQRQCALAGMMMPADWEGIRHRILEREMLECPVCLGEIHVDPGACTAQRGTSGGGDDGGAPSAPPPATMLSCSHCFHAPCIETLENFFAGVGGGAPSVPRCPVCRCGYARRPLFD